MFQDNDYVFRWEHIGDIQEGRPNLGGSTGVAVYRLMQFTLRSVLIQDLGPEKANELFFRAGKLAGEEFCRNVLDVSLDFNEFIADLQAKLKELKIGVLRIEEANLETMKFVLTVAEDLDCSGLDPAAETVCTYDEGFITGLMEAYTKKPFTAKEVDCWATGGRVCRFVVGLKE
jgi:uncharacterized protein